MLFSNQRGIGARAYRETVTIIRQDSATDEFGVQALSSPDATIVVPASVQMLSAYMKTSYYQTAEIEAYEVRMRFIPCKISRLVWNGVTLTADSVEDVGMRGRELKILASRRADL